MFNLNKENKKDNDIDRDSIWIKMIKKVPSIEKLFNISKEDLNSNWYRECLIWKKDD